MSREKWGSSQSWWCRPAVWPPGEKWGGYVAASRSPSGGADGVAARAATPPGGVDRDNSSSRAIASASASISRAATWPPIARYVQCSEHAYEAAVEAVVGARRELAAGRRDAEAVATREARRRRRDQDLELHRPGSARQAFCSRRILGKRWPRSARTVARFAQALTVSPSSGLGSSAARRRAQNGTVAMPNQRCG